MNGIPTHGRTILLINNALRADGILGYPLKNHAQVDMMEITHEGVGFGDYSIHPLFPNDDQSARRRVGSRKRRECYV